MGPLSSIKHNSQLVTLGALMLALLFVLCSSTLFHTLGSHSSGNEMPAMACCVTDGHASPDANHMASIVIKSFSSVVIFAAVLTVFFSILLLAGSSLLQTGINYIRSIRNKYGGFRILNYLQNFFSRGLLHSRDFFFLA